MCNLVAKIVAKAKYPELKLSSTRVERSLFKNEYAKVKWLVNETFQNSTEK